MALLSYIYPITMIGISVHFASLFFLITGRLVGMKSALLQIIIVHAAAIYFLDESLLYMILVTLEVSVSLWVYQRIRQSVGLFPIVLLYWAVLGIPVFVLIHSYYYGNFDFGIQLFMTALLVNQLFNALVADLITSYLPLFRSKLKIPSEKLDSPKTVLLTHILIHITIFSIVGSSFLYLINSGRLADNKLKEQTSVQGEILSSELRSSFASLTSDQLRDPTEFLRTLIASTSVTVDEAVLYDDHYFIMGYSTELVPSNDDWMNTSEWTTYSDTLHIWRPHQDWLDFPGRQWNATAIIQEVDLEQYTLYLKLSNQLFVQDMIQIYVSQAVYVLYTALIIGLFAVFLYYFVVRSISQMARLTQDVLRQLAEAQPIEWPDSKIQEIDVLIRNFSTVTMDLNRMLQVSQTQAYFDSLTGLPNRRHFNEYLNKFMVAFTDNTRLAVIFIDLDKFKPINDTLGHDIGDVLLQQVAERLKEILPTHAFLARIGGDEFVGILHTVNGEDARFVANQLLKGLEMPFHVFTHRLQIAGSIGISLFPDHGDDLHAVVGE